jgi:hypothetical protein
MRIAIAITITITAIAALAQQAHAWAAYCWDGNTDVCCHLEQIGWSSSAWSAAAGVNLLLSLDQQMADPSVFPTECSDRKQALYDRIVPLMCRTDCWGGAIGWRGSQSTMPTQEELLNTQCALKHFVDGECRPALSSSSSTASASVSSTASAPVSSTASAPVSSTASAPVSSTASTTESSSTASYNDDSAASSAGDEEDSSGAAAAPHAAGHWAFALACALVLWH